MSKIKVLIVDDANFMRELVRKAVRTLFPGFVLRDAADGNQAKGMIQQETFDLILCDWEMPKMSGDELLGWVRNESDCKDVPFILVTSRGDKDHVVKAVQLKANNYIVKPFSNDKLTGVVSKVLTQSKGISAKELMTLGGAPATAFQGKNSVDILTQSATKITTPTKITHPPKATQQRNSASVQFKEQFVAQIRWQDFKTNCLVKVLSLNSVTVIIKGDQNIPAIMEMVVFDLVTDKGNDVSRINGYTYQLQAREENQESEFVNMIIRFVDNEDEEKKAHLKRVMTNFS